MEFERGHDRAMQPHRIVTEGAGDDPVTKILRAEAHLEHTTAGAGVSSLSRLRDAHIRSQWFDLTRPILSGRNTVRIRAVAELAP
jgi:hypothetical protein